MKKAVLIIILAMFSFGTLSAQSPKNRDLGFGIVIGDPLGLTLKYWMERDFALNAYLGSSYFGAARLGADFLWHFEPFRSKMFNLYAGPGITIGLGDEGGVIYKKKNDNWYYRDEGSVGIGVRGMFGLNFVPRNTPLEIFVEVGTMIGMIPDFGAGFDSAIGIRFYP